MDQVWESTWEAGIALISWLQITYPQLEGFFLFITNLGQEEFYIALFPLVYWCLHKTMGKQLGYIFLLTVFLNALFKQLFRGPRPFWVDAGVSLDAREEGYGVPSGHTQNATVLYFFLASWISRYWFWGLAVFLVFLMGLSRIYLGAHFPHDVLGGFLLGMLTLGGFAVWQHRYMENFGKRILGQRLLIATAVPLVLGALFIIIRLIIGSPDTNMLWAERISTAERSSIDAAAQALGVVLGFGIGIVLEGSRVRFMVDGPIWKRVVRYIVGLIILIAIWAGLRQIFPEDPIIIAVPLRILRYFLTVFWAAYYAPWVFVKIGLANAEPEPEINLSLR